jgi:hypothetical protein
VSKTKRREQARRRREAQEKRLTRVGFISDKGITGCSYGVHPFVFEAVAGPPEYHHHYHVCPLCGARYFALGDDPCYACAPAPATVDE